MLEIVNQMTGGHFWYRGSTPRAGEATQSARRPHLQALVFITVSD
jgi:hypothetical protein